MAGIVHVLVLPFADLVLLSTHCAWFVVFSQLLSIFWLREKWNPRYDLPAMICVIAGSLTIFAFSNFKEVNYSVEEIKGLLTRTSSVSLIVGFGVFFIASLIIQNMIANQLAKFDRDAEIALSSNANLEVLSTITLTVNDQSVNNDEYEPQKRSQRKLIRTIQNYPGHILGKISPTAQKLKPFVMVPLVLNAINCGCITGMNTTFFKYSGEMITSKEFNEAPVLCVALIAIGVLLATLCVHLLNIMMKVYDNMDVMPMYQSCVFSMPIMFGLVLLDEASHYTWTGLVGIFAGTFTCLLGVYILYMKSRAGDSPDESEKAVTGFINEDDNYKK